MKTCPPKVACIAGKAGRVVLDHIGDQVVFFQPHFIPDDPMLGWATASPESRQGSRCGTGRQAGQRSQDGLLKKGPPGNLIPHGKTAIYFCQAQRLLQHVQPHPIDHEQHHILKRLPPQVQEAPVQRLGAKSGYPQPVTDTGWEIGQAITGIKGVYGPGAGIQPVKPVRFEQGQQFASKVFQAAPPGAGQVNEPQNDSLPPNGRFAKPMNHPDCIILPRNPIRQNELKSGVSGWI